MFDRLDDDRSCPSMFDPEQDMLEHVIENNLEKTSKEISEIIPEGWDCKLVEVFRLEDIEKEHARIKQLLEFEKRLSEQWQNENICKCHHEIDMHGENEKCNVRGCMCSKFKARGEENASS